MSKKYDLSVKTGEYTDSSGATKGRYQNVGVMMEGQNGPYILLNRTFNPAGVPGQADRESIIISMFEPRDDNARAPAPAPAPQRQAQGQSSLPPDDGIPF
jgi:hypothetical protein